ncbi:hypothetical protein BD309DRAFT_877488 [Dichomitus squalens]|nr:hypothetical protein BD309DRAFT_877488 [Dichomitus squalens]
MTPIRSSRTPTDIDPVVVPVVPQQPLPVFLLLVLHRRIERLGPRPPLRKHRVARVDIALDGMDAEVEPEQLQQARRMLGEDVPEADLDAQLAHDVHEPERSARAKLPGAQHKTDITSRDSRWKEGTAHEVHPVLHRHIRLSHTRIHVQRRQAARQVDVEELAASRRWISSMADVLETMCVAQLYGGPDGEVARAGRRGRSSRRSKNGRASPS